MDTTSSASTRASTTNATSRRPRTRFQRSELADFRDVKAEHLEGFDAVIHLAALSNDPLGDLNPQLTYDINLEGSIALAKAAKEAGVSRFLFSSSCSLYGAGADGLLDENAPFNPVTPYGESKIRVEQTLSDAGR